MEISEDVRLDVDKIVELIRRRVAMNTQVSIQKLQSEMQ